MSILFVDLPGIGANPSAGGAPALLAVAFERSDSLTPSHAQLTRTRTVTKYRLSGDAGSVTLSTSPTRYGTYSNALTLTLAAASTDFDVSHILTAGEWLRIVPTLAEGSLTLQEIA